MNLRNLFSVALLLAFGIVSSGISSADETQVVSSNKTGQPNILWLVSEDNGPQLGCYGDSYADTPNIDALATKSLRYQTCWSNAPVCAPARTTLISGMYATSLGGHHMRSGVTLPSDMKLYPQLLREAGYYCTNHTKTDYNFTSQEAGWHESGKKAHYKSRPTKETPFFHIFN
ncbi:sulfatase-like hydrolase/transferase, partial [Rubripirellula amarantea]|nr:sulfatase-like hydrolase/transferase [Rubripirellula amarantea]